MTDQKWIEITPEKAAQMMKENKDLQLIDVREREEYMEEHIRGITLIPLSQLDVRHQEIDKDKDTVLICRSGGRSSRACEYLAGMGHKRLFNMNGGMMAWEGPVEA